MSVSQSLIITSIASPNEVLKGYAGECLRRGIDFIIIGDRKSPPDFTLPGSDFWSMDRQMESGFKTSDIIPENHYSRKNIGYLVAVGRGTERILETDDDNFPYPGFWENSGMDISGSPVGEMEGAEVINRGWVNIYSLFTDEMIWPRGFPLESLESPDKIEIKERQKHFCPIQQGLADDNPDVDAVYRLTRELPLKFQEGLTFMLGKGSWCPFNSQNTVWFKEAYPLLYLPSYCSFRMTDIWRSFVAQRIAWEYDWKIAFYSPTVYQERNEHNLMKDFRDEVPGYLNNARIARELESLKLSGRQEDIFSNLVRCYEKLIGMDLVGGEELEILEAWKGDLQSIL
jgi:hypothetical protein